MLVRSVNVPQAELISPNPFYPDKKEVPRAYAVLRQVAKEQGGLEDKGSVDPENREQITGRGATGVGSSVSDTSCQPGQIQWPTAHFVS
jgi:hypothetical protein